MMHRHHPPSARRRLKHLTKMLNLTPQQQQQMLPILQDQQKQMRAMREDSSMTPQQHRAKMQECMRSTHQKLKALMTDSQKQKFDQAMQRMHQRMQKRGMGMGTGPDSGPTPAPSAGGTPPPPQQ